MSRVCTICNHPSLEEINKQLLRGESYRRIASQFDLGYKSLERHKTCHIPELLLKAQEISDLTDANNLAHFLNTEYQDIKSIKEKAIDDGNHDLALKAIDRSLKTIEIVAKVAGLIREQQININQTQNTQINIQTPEWVADPVSWISDNHLLIDKQGRPSELDSIQQDILRSHHKRIIINCHRQWGKSTISSLLCLHRAIFFPRSLCLLVAPSLRQSSENFRKISDTLNMGIELDLEEDTKLSLKLTNGSRIISLPGSQKTVRGFSAPDLIVIDEDAQASDELYQALFPMLLSNPRGRIILASTPWGQKGHFYKIWEEGGSEWLKIMVKASENSRITEEILEEARNGPNGPLWYQQEYECQFVADEFSLFDDDRINKALSDDFEYVDAENY